MHKDTFFDREILHLAPKRNRYVATQLNLIIADVIHVQEKYMEHRLCYRW